MTVKRDSMKRGFNSKVAAILLGSSVLVAGLVAGLHRMQADRSADLFLVKARQAAETKDARSTARSYQSYLRLRPNSPEARAELGKLFYDNREYEGALRELEHYLRLVPDDRDSRRLAAHSALLIGQYSDSRQHLNRLLTGEPDAELLDWLGQCQQVALKLDQAIESYTQAIELAPDRLETYVRLAQLLYVQLDQPEKAELILGQMVERNPKSPQSLLAYSQFLQTQARQLQSSGDQEQARLKYVAATEAARKSVALESSNIAALIMLASSELGQKQLDDAREHAKAAQQLRPDSVRIYLLLADIERLSGDPEQVLEWLRLGIKNVSDADRENLVIGLASYLLDLGRADEATAVIDLLRPFRSSADMVRFLQARLDMANAKWLSASKRLEAVRSTFIDQPVYTRQIDFLLGQCYGALRNTELAITALRRAIAADPSWANPRLALAGILESNGQPEAAYEELQQLMRSPNAPPEVGLLMARRSIATTLRNDPADRDWSVASQLLDQTEKFLPDAVEIPLYRAEILMAQDRAADADALLVQSLDDTGDEDRARRLTLYVSRSILAQQQQQWDQVVEILEAAEDELGNDIALRLARVSYLSSRLGDQSADELRSLATDVDDLSDQDKTRLLLGIGRTALQVGSTKLCREMFDKLVENSDADFGAWLLGYDLAIASEDADVLNQTLDQIKIIRGEDAVWHYGQAQLLRLRSDPSDPNSLREAMRHLTEAEIRLPGWTRPLLLKSQLLLRQGDMESAIAAMTRAIDLGVRTPELMRQSVSLLYQRQKYREADRLLKLIDGQQIDQLEDLQRLSSAVSVGLNDFDRALELARLSVHDSTDYQNHLWLAQLTNLMSQQPSTDEAAQQLRNEAEQAFRHALQLGKDQPQPLIEFVRFLVANDRLADAKNTMDSAASEIKPESKDIALARCYELLGETENAATAYQAALDRSPDDEALLRATVGFDMRTNRTASAETRLYEIIQLPGATDSSIAWGRRQLAVLKLAIGGPDNLGEAMNLVERNLSSMPMSAPDLRIKATLFAMQNNQQSRSQAIEIWNQIFDTRTAATPMDHYRVAQLLMSDGNWSQAAGHLRSAIASARQELEQVTFISTYISGLLDNGEFSDAELWLRRLERVQTATAVSARLEAELLARTGQHGESVALLQKALENKVQKTKADPSSTSERLNLQMIQSAIQLESVGADAKDDQSSAYHAAAEELFRRATASDRRNRFALASFLARRGRLDQSIEVLVDEEIDEEELLTALSLFDRLIRSRLLNQEQLKQLEKQAVALSEKFSDSLQILAVQASIQELLGHREKAERFFREILERDPDNLVALNNLAVSLSFDSDSLEEAARLSDRTIEIAGRQAEILDSRATIAIVAGDKKRALEWMLEATSRSRSPVLMLHRAVAYLGIGDQAKAIEDFRQIESANLDIDRLDDRDRAWYRELSELSQSQ